MLPAIFLKLTTRSARCLGFGILLAALPIVGTASTISVDFSIDGLVSSFSASGTATGELTYNPADIATTGSNGPYPYTDPNDGLVSFSVTYGGVTYTNTSASLLDPSVLPTAYLPGNASLQHGLSYEFDAIWVISGSCTGLPSSYTCTGPGGMGTATVLGFSRSAPVYLASDVTGVELTGMGGNISGQFGSPGLSVIQGTITSEAVAPEPTLLLLTLCGLAGLWFVRRRRAHQI